VKCSKHIRTVQIQQNTRCI